MKKSLILAAVVAITTTACAQPVYYEPAPQQGYYQVQPQSQYNYGSRDYNRGYQRPVQEPSRIRLEGCVLHIRNGGYQSSTTSSISLRSLDSIDTRGERVTFRSRASTKTATFYTPEDARVAAGMVQRQWDGCIR